MQRLPETEGTAVREEPERPDVAEDVPADETPHKKKHSFWRELPVLIVLAFVIALLIKSFLLQAFYIPSASMEPTLVRGDRVLVEKITTRFGGPGRGDVIVFEREVGDPGAVNEDESLWQEVTDSFRSLFGFPTGSSQDFIKRVIAIEGDEIEGRGGEVYVNGEKIEEPYLAEATGTSDFGPVQVREDHLFVMGDNRGNSDDSRSFQDIPVDSVVGHAFLLVWPPADFDTL